MEGMGELLAVDLRANFNFFLTGLRDEIGERVIPKDELFYVATILADFASTSRNSAVGVSVPDAPSDIFDNFVLRLAELRDPTLLEIGGSQTLLVAGFFRDQMSYRCRHNMPWYNRLGEVFYEMASDFSRTDQRQEFFWRMARSFQDWSDICQSLNQTLRDNRFLLQLN